MFAATDKRHRLYTKKPSVERSDLHFPPVDYIHDRAEAGRKISVDVRTAGNVQNEANRLVLARYGPAGVIVNSDFQIVQFRGQTGPYLEPAPGEASLNLLKMAREGLLHELRNAVHQARQRNRSVRKERVGVGFNDGIREVNLEVIPLSAAGEGQHFLVLFEPASPPSRGQLRPGAAKGKRRVPQEAGHVKRLQEELAASREYLQSIIQDLEAANEELQSANEEILSANEELQSTNEELDTAKEELQSTNEELNTVNEELQSRNEEMSRVNSDLVNLLGSVQIAIVMVASDLRIRRFTPMAEKVLNLIPTDVGRPISDIKPNIDCPELQLLITEAMESVTTLEREVRDGQGKMYSLRIRPYKNVDNRIDGAVLALFEVERPAKEAPPAGGHSSDSPA